jgi:Protein of unknown function (DUF2817)
VDDRLAVDFGSARDRFLTAAGRLGAPTEHFIHPGNGPAGEELALDTAWLGAADAPGVLVVVSGTHGVEGFAGSWCQSRWLESRPELPEGIAVLLVHAFNPYGFAWVRRVNEDNVDLNRNFVDFADPPVNAAYEELHAAVCPTEWTEDSRQRLAKAVVEYLDEHGADATQEAISAGQYRHPDGLYYGGSAPTWSHRMMKALWTGKLPKAERIGIVDLHTGLGPYGHGELISHDHPGSAPYERAVEWYGADAVISLKTDESVSAELLGEWMPTAAHWAPRAATTAIAIEWGTIEPYRVGLSLMADNWLHLYGDPKGPDAAAIKAELRNAFAPDEPDWLDAVWSAFVKISGQALTGLASA